MLSPGSLHFTTLTLCTKTPLLVWQCPGGRVLYSFVSKIPSNCLPSGPWQITDDLEMLNFMLLWDNKFNRISEALLDDIEKGEETFLLRSKRRRWEVFWRLLNTKHLMTASYHTHSGESQLSLHVHLGAIWHTAQNQKLRVYFYFPSVLCTLRECTHLWGREKDKHIIASNEINMEIILLTIHA